MELETEGLDKDSALKDEIPQPLILAQLPDQEQLSLPPSPFTLLKPTLGQKKRRCLLVESAQPKQGKPQTLTFGGSSMKLPSTLWIILQ